jgi:multisubunit Na+/H+ antiporter MnhF subunit
LQRSDRGFSLEIILALKMLGYSVTMPFHHFARRGLRT